MVMAQPRVLGASHFALDLGGKFAGFVNSVEGGSAYGELARQAVAPAYIVHTHITGVKYEDVIVTCGTGMEKEFYDAVKAMCAHNIIRRDASVQQVDAMGNIVTQLDILSSVLSEVSFPALDASSKEVGRLTAKLTPDLTRRKAGSGKLQVTPKAGAKQWLNCNFRVTIPGIDCSTVSKVGALTITQEMVASAVGQQHNPQAASKVDYPNLALTLSESHAQNFYDWHQDFVIIGRNTPDKLKQATLEILAPDLKSPLFTLTFRELGIFRLDTEKADAGSENIRRVRAEMYCDKLDFDYGPGALSS